MIFQQGDEVDWLQGEEGRDEPIPATVVGFRMTGLYTGVEIEVVNSPEIAEVAGPKSKFSVDESCLRHRVTLSAPYDSDKAIIHHALIQRLKAVQTEYMLLSKASERDLTLFQRLMLPDGMHGLSQRDLARKATEWELLHKSLKRLVKQYEK